MVCKTRFGSNSTAADVEKKYFSGCEHCMFSFFNGWFKYGYVLFNVLAIELAFQK